jgi:hypothetical protein
MFGVAAQPFMQPSVRALGGAQVRQRRSRFERDRRLPAAADIFLDDVDRAMG